ncbi:MAG: hypothetical protein J3R72DRAFT_518687 [Linnemannia gamsii]|nr:MAG: hypothetical protein J3R72DRAFT_518687 [Linnemannia gamsii]
MSTAATDTTSPLGPGAGTAVDSTLYYKAVGSIALYFTTVISALVICIARTRFTASNAIYILIAVSSLFITWYYILSFFQKEYITLGSDLNRFILESDLFVQAYAIVTNTLPKWWWSSQLLLLTGTALTCWSVEGQTLRLEKESFNATKTASQKKAKWTPTWWFVLLGFFGSMSVGGPLFLAQLDPNPKATRTQTRTVPFLLAALILLGEVSVIATPFLPSMSREFTLNLIATHFLFLVPSLLTFNPEHHAKGLFSTFSLPRLYFILSIIGLGSHMFYTAPFLFMPIMKPMVLYNALFFNHCQTSISADMILNNVLAAVFMIQSSKQLKKLNVGIALTLALPVLSVSTVLPLYLGWRERQLVVKKSIRDEKKKA